VSDTPLIGIIIGLVLVIVVLIGLLFRDQIKQLLQRLFPPREDERYLIALAKRTKTLPGHLVIGSGRHSSSQSALDLLVSYCDVLLRRDDEETPSAPPLERGLHPEQEFGPGYRAAFVTLWLLAQLIVLALASLLIIWLDTWLPVDARLSLLNP
jgi:uncharacterized iron-regulated membrane protein